MSEINQQLKHAIKAELFQRGEFYKVYLLPKQLEVFDFVCKTEDPFLEAPRRFGKTTILLHYVLSQGNLNPGITIRWCEPLKNQCREIVVPEMDKIQDGLPVELRWKWSSTDSYYEAPNKSRLYLRGVNDDHGESARGSTSHIIVADELGSWRDPVYIINSVLRPQLFTTGGSLIRVGTPPRNLTHVFYSMKDKAIMSNTFLGGYTIYDNETLTNKDKDKYIEEMGGIDSAAVRRELFCERIIDADYAIVPEWDDKYIVEDIRDEYFGFYHRYVSMDVGVKVDLTAVLFSYYDFQRAALVVEDELIFKGSQLTTDILASAIRQKEQELYKGKIYRRISDEGMLLTQDLSRIHKLYFETTSKGELEEMVNFIRLWAKSGRILVNSRCKNTIDCLRYGVWDEHRKKWDSSDRLGHFDALAALMYMLRNVDTRTNPVPVEYGKDLASMYLPQRTQKQEEKIRDLFNIKRTSR